MINLGNKASAMYRLFNKRTMQGGALALALIMLFTGTYIDNSAIPVRDTSFQVASTSGVFAKVAKIELSAAESSALMSAASDVTVVAATTDQVDTSEDEYDEWSDRVIADVNEYLYIRESADQDSSVVGKLRKGDVATLVDVFDGWYEIESGNAHGFVSADYCLTGMDAYNLALDVCSTYATTNVGGLRLRSEASEESKIVTVIPEGTKLTVDTEAEQIDGWVAVTYSGNAGYVKSDYVSVDLATGEAITLEEEKAAEEAAAAAAAEAKAKAAAATSQKQAVIASADDLTLLAAIIQIEAGNECYEGQVAVGAVVCNRVRSASYANSVSGVIFAKGQFATSRMSAVIAKGPKSSCYQAAQEALNGTDNTGGATHFRRAGSVSGLIIGNHVFY